MSALPTALPLALTAALYPPALLTLILLLSAKHPRGLVLAYFAGAVLMVVGVGLIGLAVLESTSSSSSTQDSSTTSGWVDIVIGLLLLAFSAYGYVPQTAGTTSTSKPTTTAHHAAPGALRAARMAAAGVHPDGAGYLRLPDHGLRNQQAP